MRYLQQSTTLHLPSTAAVITTNAHTRVVDDHAEDDFEVPQDVLEEMERERIEAQGWALWDDDAIQADINHVVNSRIAKKNRKSYDDYIICLIIFLFDHCDKFPALIPPPCLPNWRQQQWVAYITSHREADPKAIRKYIRTDITDSFQTIDPANQSTHPIILEQLNFQTLAHFLSTFSKKTTHTTVNGQNTVVPYQPGDDTSQVVHLHLGGSSYDNVTSSLANLFKECKALFDDCDKTSWSGSFDA